jgi:hypothetical protein
MVVVMVIQTYPLISYATQPLLPDFIYYIIREACFLKALDRIRCISFHSNLVSGSEGLYFTPRSGGGRKKKKQSFTYNHFILISYKFKDHAKIWHKTNIGVAKYTDEVTKSKDKPYNVAYFMSCNCASPL